MSAAYKARERAARQQLAWATLKDPKAPGEDKLAARAYIEQPEVDEDALADALTLEELRQLDEMDKQRDAIMAAVVARRANGTRRKWYDP